MRITTLLLAGILTLHTLMACSQGETSSDGDDTVPEYDGDIIQPDGDVSDGDAQAPDGDRDADPIEPDGDADGDLDTPPVDGDETLSDGDEEDPRPDGDIDMEPDHEEEAEREESDDPTLCPETQRCTTVSGGPKVCLSSEGGLPDDADTSCDPADESSCDGNRSCVCLNGDCTENGGVCLTRCGACRSGTSCRLLDMEGDFSCKSGTGLWPDDVVTNCHEGTECPDGTYCYCQITGIGGACSNSVCAESCTGALGDDLCEGEDLACGPVPSLDPFVFGCLYGGAFIPEDARRQCFRYDEEKCPSDYSCHCLDGTGIDCHESVCIRNCGRCKEGETCENSLLFGKSLCLVDGAIPPGSVTGCGGVFATTSCPQNYSCELVGTQYVCLQNCSTP